MAENVGSLSRLVTEVKVKKTRASKPKVKTGCQTCKIRRVKCDETKPSCLRCVRFGHQCDGYSNKSPSKAGSPSSSKSSRTLVPKSPTQSPLSPATSYTTTFSPVASCSTIKLCPSPPRNLFQTQHEHEAFQTFCTRTSYQLSSAFSSDLWTRLMVQACETEPSIRHAVIEIGALNLTAPLPRPESSVGTLKHNFAYRQYSKALCLLRRDVAGGICDLRTTLIACLLFYCFESFHGYHELAISQVYSGLKLIREWTTSYYKPDDSGRQRTRIGSEDPYTVEDDILRAFGNLEIQVMTYADGRSREAHEHYRHLGQEAIDDMPSVFGSLQEARTLLELVIRRSMHWLRSTMRLQNFSTPSGSPNSSPTWGEASDSRAFSLFFDVDPTFEERIKTMEEYDRWDDAFKPLLNRSRSRSAPEEDFLLASTLRLHWLSGYLSIASNNSYSSLVNNGRFTTELEELVGISRILLSRGEELCSGEFIFDMQILVPLMTVGWIYRHRALRREAIELLLRSPRKEGVWDGIVVGKIMAWLAGIEEEGLDDDASEDEDYIPEWAAARCIKMSFDTERREASVSCLQPVRGSLRGEEVRREVIIPW